MGTGALATDLLPFAEALADAAGAVLLKYYRQPIPVERKADASPVTAADREAEAAMRSLIARFHPEHGVMGEEHERVNPDAALQWVLDPIDGTRPYLAGYPTFTTLVALCENGRPALGVIDQPYLKERWVGAAGRKTLLNGSPVAVDGARDLAHAVVATTSIPYFDPAQREAYDRLRARAANAVMGGDAYAYAMLASGSLGAVADAGLKPYDFCALAPVVEGAGGVITDWSGAPLSIHSDGTVLAAASRALHEAALQSLSDE